MLRKHNIIQLENYHSEESTCQACMRRHLCLAKTLSSNDLLEFDRLVAHPEPVSVDRLFVAPEITLIVCFLYARGLLNLIA